MRIGFVGLGNMGTAMANLVAGNGFDVLGWEHDAAAVDEINARHSNSRYLPGVGLSERIVATGLLKDVFAACDPVFLAIPSVFLRPTLDGVCTGVRADLLLVNLAKGIETETGLTSMGVLARLCPGNPAVMLAGPSIATEIARRMPTVIVLAGRRHDALARLSRILDNDYFKTSHSDDPDGVELGGILKNIYAIGLGVFDGAGESGVNARAVYLTLALQEMMDIGAALGARKNTFTFLAGLGDLFATSLSEHSHNRRFGELLAGGRSPEAARAALGILPEGYNTLQVVLKIAGSRGIAVPVARELDGVMRGTRTAHAFIYSIMNGAR
jgi:glycerol-3-phosphate dehydrogenase (NAD(P)+)